MGFGLLFLQSHRNPLTKAEFPCPSEVELLAETSYFHSRRRRETRVDLVTSEQA